MDVAVGSVLHAGYTVCLHRVPANCAAISCCGIGTERHGARHVRGHGPGNLHWHMRFDAGQGKVGCAGSKPLPALQGHCKGTATSRRTPAIFFDGQIATWPGRPSPEHID